LRYAVDPNDRVHSVRARVLSAIIAAYPHPFAPFFQVQCTWTLFMILIVISMLILLYFASQEHVRPYLQGLLRADNRRSEAPLVGALAGEGHSSIDDF